MKTVLRTKMHQMYQKCNLHQILLYKHTKYQIFTGTITNVITINQERQLLNHFPYTVILLTKKI